MAFIGVSSDRVERFVRELEERGVISGDQLALAEVSQKNLGLDIGEVLDRKGILSRDKFLQGLADYLGVECGHLKDISIDAEVVKRLPESFAHHARVLALNADKDSVTVAMADPSDSFVMKELAQLLASNIHPVLVALDDLQGGWSTYYRAEASGRVEHTVERLDVVYEESATSQIEELRKMASGQKVVTTLNQILSDAYDDSASDIHIEPSKEGVQVRFRVDGLLHIKETLDRFIHLPLVSRIKILSGMDIAERRIPQDGRLHVRLVGNPLDLRISTFPTLYGEKVVMRLLSQKKLFGIEDLGFNGRDRKLFEELVEKSHGIFLVTGPTGSGKTTTLYAALARINSPDKNIISIEDPIENQIEGINQTQINTKVGVTFATSLKAVLRQDPDVIMVGEIRDEETSEIAVRAAITGHLVLATLHTNTAAGAVTRLIDLGVEPFLVASSLQGVLSQRLVRKVCRNCSKEVPLKGMAVKSQMQGKGCEGCHYSGYKGRIGIFELAAISEDARRLITRGGIVEDEIVKLWRSEGVTPLEEDGLEKVRRGETTIEEVEGVIA